MIDKEKWETLRERRTAVQNGLKSAEASLETMSRIAKEGSFIIDNIDQEFEKATKLSSKDISLLFVSVGLQIAKWAIISTVCPLSLNYQTELTPREERMTADEGDEYAKNSDETKKANEEKQRLVDEYDIRTNDATQNYSETGYRTVDQILFRPVPYDAISAFNDSDDPDLQAKTKQLLDTILPFSISGTNHRSLTFGHDPIWGWILGPINILTRSITFKIPFFPTLPVTEKGNKITIPKSNIVVEFEHAFESIQQDRNRLAASVIKQALHFASDKYTKTGLPIPFLSAEKAQELIEQNWNSVELEKWLGQATKTAAHDTGIIALQTAISYFINEIIRIIHIILCSDERIENELREVRTRRILSISNSVASTSNVVYAAIRGFVTESVSEGAKVLDIGGIIETTHRLISDISFRNEIKMEYLRAQWSDYVKKELDVTNA